MRDSMFEKGYLRILSRLDAMMSELTPLNPLICTVLRALCPATRTSSSSYTLLCLCSKLHLKLRLWRARGPEDHLSFISSHLALHSSLRSTLVDRIGHISAAARRATQRLEGSMIELRPIPDVGPCRGHAANMIRRRTFTIRGRTPVQ